MTKQKPALENSSSILLRRSERLQQRLGHTKHFSINSEKLECTMCSLTNTTLSHCHLVNKKKRTNYSRRVSSTTVCPEVLKVGNEENSDKQAKYLSSTTTSKGKNIVNVAEEILDPIWRGSFSIGDCNFSRVDELAAYNSTKACPEVLKVVCGFPALLPSELLPRLDVWPKSFTCSPLTDSIIDLYILPEHGSGNKAFSSLLESMIDQDLVIKIVLDNTTLVISSSSQLPHQCWRSLINKHYLWGVLIGMNSSVPCQEENTSPSCSMRSVVPPNLINDADAALRDGISLKNLAVEDYCREPDQILVEGPDSFGRASNGGLTEIVTSTIFANGLVEPSVSPDLNLEEADRVPEKITTGYCITPVFLRPHEDFIKPNAKKTSAQSPDLENTRRANSSSLQRQSIIDESLTNSAFRGQKEKATYTQSICTSVLNMAHNFDEDACDETTSVSDIGERVARYHMKPSLAPILHAIIENHGDIAQDCPVRFPEMLTSVLEKVCQVVQDFQALELKNVRQQHMKFLQSAILDAELVKVDVKWLKTRHDELKEAVDEIKQYESLKLSKEKNIEEIESKKTELMKLKSQVKSLECQILSLTAETKCQDGQLCRAKSKCQRFARNSLMDGLL